MRQRETRRKLQVITELRSRTAQQQRLEAYRRLASLLAKKAWAGAHDEADKLIEEMVNSDSGNYQVYLERGRYRRLQAQAKAEGQTQAEAEARRSQLSTDARQDFQKAADLAPHVPEIVLELAKAVATDKSGRSNARQILENGMKAAPKSAELYQALASIELEDGQLDKAISGAGARFEGATRVAPASLGTGRTPGSARAYRQTVSADRGAQKTWVYSNLCTIFDGLLSC